MLHEVENAGLHIAKLSASLYAVNMLPDVLGINSDRNIITKSLKKGCLLYVANETVEEVTTGNSNFRKMGSVEGWKNLADDTFYFGIGELVDDQLNLTQNLTSALSENTPLPQNAVASLVVGSFLYALKWGGTKLENNAIKSITSFFS